MPPTVDRTPRAVLTAGALAPAVAVAVAVLVLGDRPYLDQTLDAPGAVTSLASGLLHAAVFVGSVATVGGLFVGAFVETPQIDRARLVRPPWLAWAQAGSLTWAVSAVLLIGVDGADASGQPLARLLQAGGLSYLVQASYLPRAWIVVAVLACGVAWWANVAGDRPSSWRWGPVAGALLASVLATLPPVLVTQVLVGPNHDLGSDAATLGTPAATIGAGVLAVLVSRWRSGAQPDAQVLGRYLRVLSVCLAIVAASDLVLLGFETWGNSPLASATGRLFGLRLLLLGALAWLGLRVRAARSAVAGDAEPRMEAVRRLLVMSVPVASAYASVVLVMSRIPPPQYFLPASIRVNFLGYDVNVAPTFARLVADWRLNLLFAVMCVVAVSAYLIGVLRLARRGDRWPVGRTVAWTLGWLVVLVTTSSGLGRYSNTLFSLHMLLHMCLNMFGPLLLVLGGPLTLLLRASRAHGPGEREGVHEWATHLITSRASRFAYHPAHAYVAFIGSYYVLYLSPLFDHAMRYHWAHQLMDLDFLFVGYVFYALVIGVDRPPRDLPHIGKLGLLLAAMPFHAFFGVAVMTSNSVIAQTFYSYLQVPWHPDLHADQYLGGEIAWATGELPLVIVIIALMVQWSRDDARASRRVDRHLDAGLDHSFADYNAMFARLAGNDGARTELPVQAGDQPGAEAASAQERPA